jgi:hypothetical protein
MANEIYIPQRTGNGGPLTLRKIHPTAGDELFFDPTTSHLTAGVKATKKQTVATYSANGAIAIAPGVAKLTKGTAGAFTLAAPAAGDEGTVMIITSQTAAAHTVTLTEGFNNGGSGADVATFGGAIGDNMVIVAVNAHWNVVSLRNVTLA